MHTSSPVNDADDVAVACELTSDDNASQLQRWARLVRGAGLSHGRTQDGIRVAFRADPATQAELRALVAIENECCSWARWQIQEDRDAIVMQATSTGYGIDALHGMLDDLTT